jgi:ATP-binding cassette subfamily B protein
MSILKRLQVVLDTKDFYFFIILFIYTVFVSMVEVVGISAIVPFIAVVNDFKVIERNYYIKFFYELFHYDSYLAFTVFFAIMLLFYYLARFFLNTYYYYLIARFSFGRYRKISEKLFKSYLFSDYSRFLKTDSSSINRSITSEALNLSQFLLNSLVLLSEFIVMILLYVVLVIVNFRITFFLTILFIGIFIILVKVISKRIKQEGVSKSTSQKEIFDVIGASFNNFKIIKLMGVEGTFIYKFVHSIIMISGSLIKQQTLSNLPRLILETAGFCILIICVLYYVYADMGDISKVIPILSILVLALYRMLPSYNRIISSYNNLMFNINSVSIVSNELSVDIETAGNEVVLFNSIVELKNISFYYRKGNFVLKNLNLEVNKASKIGIIGESGIGKSTLLDIIMGLLWAKEGEVLIDKVSLSKENVRNWRGKIGYIPQNVYLFNDTVENNILFGRALDDKQLTSVLKQANIDKFLKKVSGTVGEGGINLSGGERQRVAIARALYGKPELLIMDEATSALDLVTEKKIIEELFDNCPYLTIIIVSHRYSTLEKCDEFYEMKDGTLKKI